MKHNISFLFTAILVIAIFFSSCSGSKEMRQTKRNIDGAWTVQTVSVEGNSAPMNLLVFNEANFKCFIGSVWTLSKKNSGYYEIPAYGKDCAAIKRYIYWSINQEKAALKEFHFKRLDENKKAIDNTDDYKMEISLLNENSMQLRFNTMVEGKAAVLVYNFTRN
jgi:hypothetical protein